MVDDEWCDVHFADNTGFVSCGAMWTRRGRGLHPVSQMRCVMHTVICVPIAVQVVCCLVCEYGCALLPITPELHIFAYCGQKAPFLNYSASHAYMKSSHQTTDKGG